MGCRVWLGFSWTINGKAKKIDDDAGYGAFVVGVTAFSAICKINKAIGLFCGMEYDCENLLTAVMGGSAIKSSSIYDVTVWEARQLADEVLDILEYWYRWGSNLAWETVDIINEIRAGVLHNTEKKFYMCTEFSKVALL